MSENTIEICFKVSGGSQFTLNVDESWTIRILKEKCREKTDIPEASQRIVYKGRILKDDDTISNQGMKSGHVIHLVKTAAAAASTANTTSTPNSSNTTSTTTPTQAPFTNTTAAPNMGTDPFMQAMLSGMGGFPGMGNLGSGDFSQFMQDPAMRQNMPGMGSLGSGDLSQLMQSPLIQQAIESIGQNPQAFRAILESNSNLRPMMPMFQNLLNNPELLRSMLNPQMVQAAMQMQQAMQSQQFQQGAQQQGAGTEPGGDVRLAAMMQQARSAIRQNPELVAQMVQAMSNPDAQNMMNLNSQGDADNPMLRTLEQMAGGGFGGGGVLDSRPPEERFAAQLQSLSEMGFVDMQMNIQVLTETNGDVHAAISRILERGLGN